MHFYFQEKTLHFQAMGRFFFFRSNTISCWYRTLAETLIGGAGASASSLPINLFSFYHMGKMPYFILHITFPAEAT